MQVLVGSGVMSWTYVSDFLPIGFVRCGSQHP